MRKSFVSPATLGRYKAIYNNLTAELMAEFKAGKIGAKIFMSPLLSCIILYERVAYSLGNWALENQTKFPS